MRSQSADDGAGSIARNSAGRLATGRLCLELVATVHRRLTDVPSDDLTGPQELSHWLSAVGIAMSPSPTQRDLGQFRSLREAIYRLVAATGGAVVPDAEADLKLVNQCAGVGLPASRLKLSQANGRTVFGCDMLPLSSTHVLALFARDAIDLLAGQSADLLHQCEGGPCGTFFVDSSRGGRRRWCLSATCGNRNRVGEYRSRMSRGSRPATSSS